MTPEVIQPITQFGVAGLMGVLWVWERTMSRRRDTQLDAAHEQILRRQDEMKHLVDAMNQNTRALERFEQTQIGLRSLLEEIHRDLSNRK